MFEMKKKVEEKGITLIALVITILVIAILAGVTLKYATGSNGLIGQSKKSVNSYAGAQDEEQSSLNALTSELESANISGGGNNGGTNTNTNGGNTNTNGGNTNTNGGNTNTSGGNTNTSGGGTTDNTTTKGNQINSGDTTDTFDSSTITFLTKPITWTNGNVLATAYSNKTGYSVQTSKDGSSWFDSPTQEYGANGTLYARLANASGTVSTDTASISITVIDKVKPTTVASTFENQITIYGTDANSGVTGYLVSTGSYTPDISSFTTIDNSKSAQVVIKDLLYNTDYYCFTCDAAGNISDSFKIRTDTKAGAPVLLTGMSPIKWNGSTWAFCQESDADWYNYKTASDDFDEKQSNWANAMTVDGSMWVWIPRYEYKITQRTGDSTTAGKIEVKLISKNQTTADSGYIIHPSFRSNVDNGGFGEESAGFWLAKYKSSGTTTTPVSKANASVMRGTYSTNSMYTSSYNYNRNYDSHLFKNSEWGAVSYLTQSQYGRNGHEVSMNTTEETSGVGGVNSSTTGNIYGVFDLVTDGYEYVSAGYKGYAKIDSSTAVIGNSTKYIDSYSSVKGKVGDATNGDNPSTEGWYSDQVITMTNTNYPYLMRGCGGIFSFDWYSDAWTYATWRMALSGTNNVQNDNISLALSNTNWTNNNVSVTATTTQVGYKIQTSTDGSNWTLYSSPITFKQNGTLYARLIDGNGVISQDYKSINIGNIDKVNPSVDEVKTYANTINLTASDKSSNTDAQSGIVAYGYSTNATTEPTNYISCDSATTLYATIPDLQYATTYYIWAKDAAGNVALVSDTNKITTQSIKVGKPNLLTNMTPVKYDVTSSKWVYCNEDDDQWYDYSHPASSNDSAYVSSRWANAMTSDGSMWVWMPRYEYKVTDKGSNAAGKVDIMFISKDKTVADNGYTINPAFTNDSANNYQNGGWDSEIQGFWVAKYKTSNSEATPKSVANASYLVGGYSTNRMYVSSYNYNRQLESHLQKNTEYGAVALLTQSQYGRNGYQLTGNSTLTTGGGGNNNSTTGNIYGAFDYDSTQSDTNGSTREYVAAGLKGYAKIDSSTTAMTNNSKYVNLYSGSTGVQGDATNSEQPSTEGWFADEHYENSATNCYLMRGWDGIFSYYWYTDAYAKATWRMVLIGDEKTATDEATRTAVNVTAKPVLMDTMRPVKYDSTSSSWVFCEQQDKDWYDYYSNATTYENNSSHWANAMTSDGSMWVWVPRFEYKITQRTGGATTAGSIDIKFIPKTQTVADEGYIIHSVFRDDSKNNYSNGGWNSELSGFWAAKYKSSGTTTTPASKPNVNVMLGTYSTNSMYTSSANYDTTLNSHQLKNTEWGAIAYLTQSSYGKNGYEVSMNTTEEKSGSGGNKTSTTGNEYGIFDMVTDGYEYVAAGWSGYAKIDSSTAVLGASSKYINSYTSVRGITGDATNADLPSTEGWFSDQAIKMTTTTSPYLMRGNGGIFSFYWYPDAYSVATWRMALAGEASQTPYLTINATPTAATSGSVSVTVSTSITGYKSLQTSTDGTNWTNYSTNITINKNCTVYAKVVANDSYGVDQTYYTSLVVANIDSTKPVINSITSYANTVTINATDSGDSDGIVGYAVTDSSSTTPTNWTSVDNCTQLNATIPDLSYDKEYYVWVKDASGNISIVTEKTHIKTQTQDNKVAKPVLLTGMQPMIYDDASSKWKICNETDSWYDYSNFGTTQTQENTFSKWANAITADGSMWVWVPRFEYKVNGKGSNAAGTVNVIFISKNKTVADNGYTINPAFKNDSANNYANGGWDSELQGFWVAKYKTSNSEATPKSVPNASYLCGAYSTNRMYVSSYNYNRDLDSHLQKNTEYGAVALLTQSGYGKNGYELTGNATWTTGAGGVKNSTTGNMYGAFDYDSTQSDTSGGVREYVSAGLKGISKIDSSTNVITGGTKYVNSYDGSAGIKGDATNAETPSTEGWFGDENYANTSTDNVYLMRGWNGIFSYYWYTDAYARATWRMVLAGDAHQITTGEAATKLAVNVTAKPVLQDDMRPIKYYNNKWNFTFADDTEWYNYYAESTPIENKSSQWANAMTTDGSMWVWIPRFEYKITQRTGDATTAGKIDVKIIPKTQTVADSGYIIHPVFTNDSSNNYDKGGWDKELSGIWIAKYKTSGSVAAPVSKPNASVLRSTYTTNNMYTSSLSYNTAINSHLLKNSEWGAIAYFSHSQYGRNGFEIKTTTTPATSGAGGNDTSTTGNLYGIFDLVTNEYEYVSAGYTGYAKISGSTAITGSTKYINGYTTATGKVGDASNGDSVSTDGWFSDQTYKMTGTGVPYLMRGNSGIFSYYWYSDAWTYATWRMAAAE